MIGDFQHVCITCRNLERSIRFYENFGLEVVEPISELDEGAIARAFQTPEPSSLPTLMECSFNFSNGYRVHIAASIPVLAAELSELL